MGRFAQWIEDRRWAANVRRARAERRKLSFSRRIIFDRALQPKLGEGAIAYPDAFYHVTIDDLVRAMLVARLAELKEG